MSTRFSEHLPFDAFKEAYELAQGDDFKASVEMIQTAVSWFLLDLRDAKSLSAIDLAEGYDVEFLNAWNAMVRSNDANERDAAAERVAEHFTPYILPADLFHRFDEGKISLEDHYEKIEELMTRGDMSWRRQLERYNCFRTGARVLVDFVGWKPTAGICIIGKKITDGLRFEALPELAPDNIKTLTVNFPTGELLISDWFRIPEFTKSVEPEKMPDLNCAVGREEMAAHYAHACNFLSISVGNSSPRLLEQEGFLLFACDSEDSPDGYVEHDSVTTDLWNVTVIDKADLIRLVAKETGEEKAAEEVESYLSTTPCIQKLKVDPGEYHAYYMGDYWKVTDLFSCEERDTDGISDVMLAISQQPLTLREKQKAEVLPAP